MKFIASLILFLSSSNIVFGQMNRDNPDKSKGIIAGLILELEDSAPIEYATVTVFRTGDSSLVSGGLTDATGKFKAEVPLPGAYYLRIEFIGYQTKFISGLNLDETARFKALGQVKIEKKSHLLKNVEITAEQSTVQNSLDKKVFNVGKDITVTGGTAADVLQNVPSVTVDMDGNVSLRGNSNVRILIDGKPSGLTGIGGTQGVDKINAANIESVEVVTNPSARYDSEGMAGIINIVLKKQKQKGLNGLFSAGYGFFQRYHGSVNLNYNTGKVNYFINYDFRDHTSLTSGVNNRKTVIRDTVSYLDQVTEGIRQNVSHTVRGGFDFNLNPKNSISVSGLTKLDKGKNIIPVFYSAYDYNHEILYNSLRNNIEKEPGNSGELNVNYKKSYEQKGRSFSVDGFYSNNYEKETNEVSQYYLYPGQSFSFFDNLRETIENEKRQVTYTGQADYVLPLKKNSKFESGVKSNHRTIINGFSYSLFDTASGIWTYLQAPDKFEYQEMVNAAYAVYSGSFKDFTYSAGLRSEMTDLNLFLADSSVSKNSYLDLFPSAYVGFDFHKAGKMQVGISRRLNRPSSGNLNPYREIQDPLNVRTGNPNLKPEYTQAIDLNHIFYLKNLSVNPGVYYRYSTGMIGRVKNLNDNGVTVTSFENLNRGTNYGIEFSVNGQITKWWRMNFNYNYYRNIVNGENIRSDYSSDAFSWNTRLNNNFNFWKGIDFQISGSYRAPMEVPMGTIKAMYFLDAGAKKEFLNNKLTVSIKFNDVLNSMKFRIDAEGPGYTSYMEHRRNNRNLMVTASYKLNSYKQKDKKRNQDQGGMDEMDF